jgi:hypothetical protein
MSHKCRIATIAEFHSWQKAKEPIQMQIGYAGIQLEMYCAPNEIVGLERLVTCLVFRLHWNRQI